MGNGIVVSLEEEFERRYIEAIKKLKKDKKLLLAVGHYLVMIDKLEKAKRKSPFLKPILLTYQMNILEDLEKTINKKEINKDKVIASVFMLGAELLLRKIIGGENGR